MQGLSLSTPEPSTVIAAGMPGVERAYGSWTLAVVAAITAARLIWLAVQSAGLYPDEAQYWFWAQHPAFGYYSKPPLVAWLIWLTTAAFGDSEFAIRLSAPLLHAGAAGIVYAIAARLYDRRDRVLVGARLCDAAGRVAVGLHHLDRRGPAAVLGGGALCLHPRARAGRRPLVAGRRDRRRSRPPGEIRDGLLALVGVRLCPPRSGGAAPSADRFRRHRHRDR